MFTNIAVTCEIPHLPYSEKLQIEVNKFEVLKRNYKCFQKLGLSGRIAYQKI